MNQLKSREDCSSWTKSEKSFPMSQKIPLMFCWNLWGKTALLKPNNKPNIFAKESVRSRPGTATTANTFKTPIYSTSSRNTTQKKIATPSTPTAQWAHPPARKPTDSAFLTLKAAVSWWKWRACSWMTNSSQNTDCKYVSILPILLLLLTH